MTETKEMLKSLVPTMTAGAHQARFHAASTKPNRCEVITVTFDGNNGQPFLRSSVEPDCFQTASGGHIPKRSKAISGGHVRIYSSILSEGYMPDGYPSVRNISLLIHELGHAFGLAHSFRGKHSVSRGYFEPVITHSPIEIEAFELLYDLPVGTKLEQMITDEKISRAVLTPFPRIDDLRGVRESSWYSVPRKVNGVTKYSVEAGSEIILTGSRLTLRFGQDYDYDFGRPSNYNHPVAVFAGGESFKMNTKAVYQEATGSGGYSRNLRLRIPSGAESGWFYIRARGLESNPIWLEIV